MKLPLKALFVICFYINLTHGYTICAYRSQEYTCVMLERRGKIKCVYIDNEASCLTKIDSGEIDFGLINAETAFVMSLFTPNVIPIAEDHFHYDMNHIDYEIVVVSKQKFTSPKGMSYCHPGFGVTNISPLILKQFEQHLFKIYSNLCITHFETSVEWEIFALNEIFGPSCRPGIWIYDNELNERLHKKYPALTELCFNLYGTPFEQSLSCMLNTKNSISVTTLSTIETNVNKTITPLWFYCKNGTLSREPCVWSKELHQLLIINNKKEKLRQELNYWLNEDINIRQYYDFFILDDIEINTILKGLWYPSGILWYSQRFKFFNNYNTSQSLINLKNFIRNDTYFPSADDWAICKRKMRWCTISDEEQTNCNWLSQSSIYFGMYPVIECVQKSNKLHCLEAINEQVADLITTSASFTYDVKKYDLSAIAFPKTRNNTNTLLLIKDNRNIDNLENLKGKKGCFQDSGIAWKSFVEATRGIFLPQNSCDYGKLIDLLGDSCLPGAMDTDRVMHATVNSIKMCELCQGSPGNTCDASEANSYFNTSGALKCLNDIGDFAVIVHDPSVKLYNKIMCKNGTILTMGVWAIDEECYLSTHFPSLKIIARTNDPLNKDIQLAFMHIVMDISNANRYYSSCVFEKQTSTSMFCSDDYTSTSSKLRQKWCKTLVGSTVILPCENPCRNDDGTFATRRCSLIDGIAKWSKIYNPCNRVDNLSNLTKFLNNVVQQFTPAKLKYVSTKIESESSTLTELDVELVANILHNTSNQPIKMEDKQPFFDVINNLLNVNQSLLKTSQKFGSTHKIIESMDNFVINLSKETASYSVNLTNIALVIIKPIQANSNDDHYNINFNNVAVKIPNEILSTSILTIYKSNHLFPEGNVVSEIVDLKILGITKTLNNPISLYLHVNSSIEVVCSFWNVNEKNFGEWASNGIETIRISDDLVECKTDHLTTFVLLGISDKIFESLSSTNQLALQIISTILCSFSLIGLIMVFVTCFFLKKWYTKRINTIQISIVIALEIFLIFLNDVITIEDGLGCTFFGVFMHYFVLAKFIVTLLIAKMQYENFVTVLSSRNKSRNSLFGSFIPFSVPIVIIGISIGIFPEHYNSGNVNFCYPKAEAFIYFLIIPVASILIANIIIFSLVMFKISSSIYRDNKQKMLQLKLAVMLFFMLGLSWIFSVVSHLVFTPSLQLMFIYTFSILSPLQGFIIFVFAIVFDSDAKTFWFYKTLTYSPVDTEITKNTTSTAIVLTSFKQFDNNN